MNRHQAADDRAVVDGHVPGHLDGVRDDHVVTDHAVVRDVDVGHQEAPRTDRRLPGRRAAAIDRGILTNDRAVADLHPRLFALVLEVLGIVADHRAVADLHAVPDTRGPITQYGPTDTSGPSSAVGSISAVRWITGRPPSPSSPPRPLPGRPRIRRLSCGTSCRGIAASPARTGSDRRARPAAGTSPCRAT